MLNMKLLDKIEKKNDKAWSPLRQVEGVLVAAQNLPCFHGNDEVSMESFEHIDPILELCLGKIKKILSQHNKVTDQLNKLSCLERENQVNTKPELSDGIELLMQYSELMKSEIKDNVWEKNIDQLKDQIFKCSTSNREFINPMAFIKKLIEENNIRKPT